MVIERILYSIFLSSISDCCNEKTTTFKNQRYAPAPPVWQLHLRQLHQLGSSIRAESRQLHQLGRCSLAAAFKYHLGQSCADTISFQISRDGGRRRFYAIAAPVAPHHSEDPSPSDPPFQRCLQSDTRNYLQSPCQRKASSKPGARFIDVWRTLPQRARQSAFSECSDYMYAGMR